MLLLEGLMAGLLVGFVTRGSLAGLQDARLTRERFFLVALLVYFVWPRIGESLGVGQREFIFVWLLVALTLAGLALMNARYVGMVLAAVGLLANILVISLNGAMPVDVARAGSDAQRVASGVAASMLHEPLVDETRMLGLSDVILVPGPQWHRALVSYGDLLLALGAGATVLQMTHTTSDDVRP